MFICILGYYGLLNNLDKFNVVKFLSFYMSCGKYGLYGEEIGMFFILSKIEGKVLGLYGRSSFYLDVVGVYM